MEIRIKHFFQSFPRPNFWASETASTKTVKIMTKKKQKRADQKVATWPGWKWYNSLLLSIFPLFYRASLVWGLSKVSFFPRFIMDVKPKLTQSSGRWTDSSLQSWPRSYFWFLFMNKRERKRSSEADNFQLLFLCSPSAQRCLHLSSLSRPMWNIHKEMEQKMFPYQVGESTCQPSPTRAWQII